MKKMTIFMAIVMVALSAKFGFTDNMARYMYGEAHLNLSDPVYLDLTHSRNFVNEQNTTASIVMSKPFESPWVVSLDGGPMIHVNDYKQWNEKKGKLESKRAVIIGALLVPEINLNGGLGPLWLNFRIRDELKVKYNGQFDTNLFLLQFRAWSQLIQLDAAYTTFDLGRLGGIRYPGTDSELRFRAGLTFRGVLEPGFQMTWVYFQSEIWESQYRSDGGVYARINVLPIWLEVSWERMSVLEKDRRINKMMPEFYQDRILFSFGFTNEESRQGWRTCK